jgi:arylsulfatase A-like enzyme
MDTCFGSLLDTLACNGLDQNTIVVFTSDHGDMLYSQGQVNKQQPWDESIRVPFLIRYPQCTPKTIKSPISTPDIMPTLLSLSNIDVPETCEGMDLSEEILGAVPPPTDRPALITCPAPFGQWNPINKGGYEFRGVRTKRYTYVRDLNGPKLLFDNQQDTYQITNIVNHPDYMDIQAQLESQLQKLLCKTGDIFQTRQELISRCGYKVDSTGTVPYYNSNYWGQVSFPCRDDTCLNRHDVSGPDDLPDCTVDEYDLARFTEQWLQNNDMTDFSDFARFWLH